MKGTNYGVSVANLSEDDDEGQAGAAERVPAMPAHEKHLVPGS